MLIPSSLNFAHCYNSFNNALSFHKKVCVHMNHTFLHKAVFKPPIWPEPILISIFQDSKTQFLSYCYRKTTQGKDQQVVELVSASAIPRCCPDETCQSPPSCALMLKTPPDRSLVICQAVPITGSYTATDPHAHSPCCQSIPIFNRYMTCQIQYEPHGCNENPSLILRMPQKGKFWEHFLPLMTFWN